MKLKKAISIYSEKHGRAADNGDEGSFGELLAKLSDEQSDAPSDKPETELISEPQPDSAAETEIDEKPDAPSKKTEKKAEPAVLAALGTRRAVIIRILLAAAMLLVCAFLELPSQTVIILKAAAALIVGYDLVIKAVSDARRLSFVSGALAVIAAAVVYLCIGRANEAVIALIVYKLGALSLEYAAERIHKGCRESFEPAQGAALSAGEMLDLGEGMSAPADCEVIAGSGSADMSSITGDRSAVSLTIGSFVPSGSAITRGVMTAKVLSSPDASVPAVICRTLLNGAHSRTEAVKRTGSAARAIVFSLIILSVVILALLPTVFHVPVLDSLGRAATVLALAAPGGLLLAVPLTQFIGITAARRIGIVFRRAADLEKTAALKSVVFDKVGVLTGRDYIVSDIATDKMDPATFLKVAAYAEAGGDDPIARAIVAAYGKDTSGSLIENYVRYEGRGVSVMVDGINILLGSQGFLAEQGISLPRLTNDGLAVYMTVSGIYAGRISLSDYVIPTAGSAINHLTQLGVERVSMMSADNRERDLAITRELNIDEYIAECPASDRPRRVKELKARIDPKCSLAYVSANLDAKDCFAAADVGIAVGGVLQPRLLELSDVTVLPPAPDKVADAVAIAQGVQRFIRMELAFSVASKLVVLMLSAFGFIPLYLALLLDAIASMGVLLDSRAALRLGGSISYGRFLR